MGEVTTVAQAFATLLRDELVVDVAVDKATVLATCPKIATELAAALGPTNCATLNSKCSFLGGRPGGSKEGSSEIEHATSSSGADSQPARQV